MYVLSVRACPGDFVMLIAKILVYSTSTTYELVVLVVRKSMCT